MLVLWDEWGSRLVTKTLRVVSWLNCLASILLALSVLVFWIVIFNAPHNQPLFTAASVISFICMIALPILGVCMVVMEILSRRDRSHDSAGDDTQTESF